MRNIAILLPGQGSQYIGMGKKLYNNFSVVKEVFEEASSILGFDLKRLCFDGDMDELAKTENAQPTILTVSFAAFKAFIGEMDAEPSFLTGHSLGEISALTCSGVIRFCDAIQIVKIRGKLMHEAAAGIGAMVAIMGTQADVIEEECRKISDEGYIVEVSNYNSPEQIIISGHNSAVNDAVSRLELKGARIMPINVNAPFHCSLMGPVKEKFAKELKKYKYGKFKYPVISNVNALPYESERQIIDYLTKQVISPVRWQECIEFISRQGIKTFIEIGPQAVLRNLLLTNDIGIEVFSYDDKRDKEFIREALVKADRADGIDKERKYKLINKCLAIAICTENRNWNNEEYSKGVTEPYRNIQSMLESLEKENIAPTYKQMKDALDMLKKVFITKSTPMGERGDRFKQVLYETGLFDIFSDYLNC